MANDLESAAGDMTQRVLSAFEADSVPVVKVGFLYRLGLILVAICMILLPAIYIALVIFLGWGVYHHATQNSNVFDTMGARAAALTYFTPLIVGIIGVFFMIKPLFAPRRKGAEAHRLQPGEEPVLDAFVSEICKVVGAPKPRDIELNCEVNAAASLRRGFLSIFGRDLRLVIGLPLVAGMDMRAFGGVLAHEFGHFGQGAGMGLTYIIRRINGWFARVVYERDAWDERLKIAAENAPIWFLQIPLFLAMISVWISRQILKVLMYTGHAISCFAARQMEYDADSYETYFAGSEQFRKTSERLQMLGVGSMKTQNVLQSAWGQDRLADNYPELNRGQTDSLDPKIQAEVRKGQMEARTGFFDTHPADSDRIKAAMAKGADGIFRLEEPAALLFVDYEKQCRFTTLHYYREEIGLDVQPGNLVDTGQIQAESDAQDEASRKTEEYFAGQVSPLDPLFITRAEVAENQAAESAPGALGELREAAVALAKFHEESFKKLEPLREEKDKLRLVQSLQGAGFQLNNAKAFELRSVAPVEVQKDLALANQQIREIRTQCVEPYHLAAKARMREALAQGTDQSSLLVVLEYLAHVWDGVDQLRDLTGAQEVLFNQLGDEVSEEMMRSLRKNSEKMLPHVNRVRAGLGEVAYPFEHAKEGVTLAQLVTPEIDPAEDLIFQNYHKAEAIVGQLYELYWRVMGVLASEAGRVEEESLGA